VKISFGSGHDHASLVSSPTLNATGDAPCPSFRSGESAGLSCAMVAGLVAGSLIVAASVFYVVFYVVAGSSRTETTREEMISRGRR